MEARQKTTNINRPKTPKRRKIQEKGAQQPKERMKNSKVRNHGQVPR